MRSASPPPPQVTANKAESPNLFIRFNTQAAWPYRRHGGKEVSGDSLLARRENWPEGTVPDGVALLTAGIDTQDYRVEVEIVGWGRDEESWSVEHHVIDGEMSDSATRAALEEFLTRTWSKADGTPLAVRAACIDSGGHHTEVTTIRLFRADLRSENRRFPPSFRYLPGPFGAPFLDVSHLRRPTA